MPGNDLSLHNFPDRIAIMDRGILQQVGPPREVYRDPANMFVAGFLGSPPMNFWAVQIGRDGNEWSVTSNGVKLPLSNPTALTINSEASEDVLLGIRPEHIVVKRNRADAMLPAKVILVEDLGNEVLLDLRVDQQPLIARLPVADAPAYGDTVWLEFPAEYMYAFDPVTEARI